MDCLTILDLAESYLDFAHERFVMKTYKEKKSVFANFFKRVSSDILLQDLNTPMAFRYLSFQAKKRSGNAANKERKNLVAAWNWGVKYLESFPIDNRNPFLAVERFPEKRHPRYVPPEVDFRKVLEATEGQDKVMLLAFLHLAARRSELFNLVWEDIDFGNRQIRLWTSKRKGGTREFDWLPMTSELRQALVLWWQERPLKSTPYVFVCLDERSCCTEYFGKPYRNRQQFMQRLCKRVGVKRFGFHAIRHLTANILYHKGYEVSVIQSILRHKKPTTTNRYLKSLGLEATREALEKGLQGPGTIVPFPRKRKASEGQF